MQPDSIDFQAAKSLRFHFAALHLRTFSLLILAGLLTALWPNPRLAAQDAVQPARTETSPPANDEPTPAPIVEAPQNSRPTPVVTLNDRPVAETPRRFHYGFVFTLRGAYDDNINLAQNNPDGDFYTSIEPVISLGFGGGGEDQTNRLNFIYAPNAYIFAKRSDADALQHVIHLDAQRQFAKLTVDLGEDIQILDSSNLTSLNDTTGRQANVDVGARTRENVFTTRLGASYDLSSKTSLNGSMNYQVYDYPSLLSSETIQGSLFLNYNYGAKVIFGIGGTGGYDTAEGPSADQYFEQINGHLSYQATGKVTLNATGGIEIREFANNARGNYTSPVFNLSANYTPFDGTSLSLKGSRTTRNSASISGSDFAQTNIDFAASQRFFQRAFVAFNVGYENDNYFSAARNIDVSRADDYYYIQTSVDLNVTRFWTVGAYYLHREDSSSLDFFQFSDNQFGVRTSLTF